jgi:hypothetical protein
MATSLPAFCHSVLCGCQRCSISSFSSRAWTAFRSFSWFSRACRRAVSVLRVASLAPLEILAAVVLVQTFVAAARSFLSDIYQGAPHLIVKPITYWLPCKFTSFCQYSICNVSSSGSFRNPRRYSLSSFNQVSNTLSSDIPRSAIAFARAGGPVLMISSACL